MAINNVYFNLVGRECFANIIQTSASPVIVNIFGYTKVLTEQQQTINLTAYMREQISISPIWRGLFTVKGGAITPSIEIDGREYAAQESWHIGERKYNKHASDLPFRLIAPGQADTVTTYIVAGGAIEIDSDAGPVGELPNEGDSGSLGALYLRPTEDMGLITLYNLDDSGVSDELEHIHYIFRPMGLNGKRLAWINRYGALDFWNFDFLREQDFVVASETIYTQNGYQKIAKSAEKVYIMETKGTTREVLDALSFIIASPAVWVVTDDLVNDPIFDEVDIITEECRVYSDDDIHGMQISYRPKKRAL